MGAPEVRSTPKEALTEQMFRVLADAIPHMVWSSRPDGVDDYCNRRLCEYTGLTRKQLSSRAWLDIVHPEDLERFRARWSQALAQGTRYEIEYRLRRHDGAYLWHLATAEPLREEGRIVRWFGTCTEIEARKQAERLLEESRGSLESQMVARTDALRESEARFRSLAQLSSDWYWEQDENLRFVAVSPQLESVMGLSAQSDVGKTRWELPTLGVSAEQWASHRRTLESRLPFRDFEYRRLNERGEPVWFSISGEPMFDDRGRFRGYRGIGRNLTALRENEKRVVEATETVRQLMNRLVDAQEAERRKLAVDLHDLIGQKLTALGINLDLVRQRMPQAGAVALAPRLHQMSTLLEETIGAIREVMSDLRPQVLDEHGLSAALYQYASVFETRTGLRVQVSGAEKRLPLPHDVAIALFRIAQEALTNAAKHSGASCVKVRVSKNPQRVELRVEDDGRGFPAVRGPRPREGGGWGLSMMRERADAVGGELRIERADPGTRIVVVAPIARAD